MRLPRFEPCVMLVVAKKGVSLRLSARGLDLSAAEDPQISIKLTFGSDTFKSTNQFRAMRNGWRYP